MFFVSFSFKLIPFCFTTILVSIVFCEVIINVFVLFFWCSRMFSYYILVASIVIKMCDCNFKRLFVFERHSSSFFFLFSFYGFTFFGFSRWAPRWVDEENQMHCFFALFILYFWKIKIYFSLLLILNKKIKKNKERTLHSLSFRLFIQT